MDLIRSYGGSAANWLAGHAVAKTVTYAAYQHLPKVTQLAADSLLPRVALAASFAFALARGVVEYKLPKDQGQLISNIKSGLTTLFIDAALVGTSCLLSRRFALLSALKPWFPVALAGTSTAILFAYECLKPASKASDTSSEKAEHLYESSPLKPSINAFLKTSNSKSGVLGSDDDDDDDSLEDGESKVSGLSSPNLASRTEFSLHSIEHENEDDSLTRSPSQDASQLPLWIQNSLMASAVTGAIAAVQGENKLDDYIANIVGYLTSDKQNFSILYAYFDFNKAKRSYLIQVTKAIADSQLDLEGMQTTILASLRNFQGKNCIVERGGRSYLHVGIHEVDFFNNLLVGTGVVVDTESETSYDSTPGNNTNPSFKRDWIEGIVLNSSYSASGVQGFNMNPIKRIREDDPRKKQGNTSCVIT